MTCHVIWRGNGLNFVLAADISRGGGGQMPPPPPKSNPKSNPGTPKS